MKVKRDLYTRCCQTYFVIVFIIGINSSSSSHQASMASITRLVSVCKLTASFSFHQRWLFSRQSSCLETSQCHLWNIFLYINCRRAGWMIHHCVPGAHCGASLSLRNMLCVRHLKNSFWSRRIYNHAHSVEKHLAILQLHLDFLNMFFCIRWASPSTP